MTARFIETRAARVTLEDDGVVRVIVHRGAEVGADDMRAFLAARMALAPHRVPVIIDQRLIRSMTRQAQVAATEGASQRPTLCVAILMGSPLTVMIANFFVIFGKPHYPTRLFTSEESALAWIAQLRESRADAHV